MDRGGENKKYHDFYFPIPSFLFYISFIYLTAAGQDRRQKEERKGKKEKESKQNKDKGRINRSKIEK